MRKLIENDTRFDRPGPCDGIVELRNQFPFNFFTGQLHRAFLTFDFLSINFHKVGCIEK